MRRQKDVFVQAQKGGVLASTHRWKCRWHVEDGSLASLKTEPKNKRRQRRSRSRGLIDRDVCRWDACYDGKRGQQAGESEERPLRFVTRFRGRSGAGNVPAHGLAPQNYRRINM